MLISRRVLIALLFAVVARSATAQTNSEEHRISVAVLIGRATADTAAIECCELRTPPDLRPLEERVPHTMAGIEGRWHVSRRTTTFLRFERSRTAMRHLFFPRPTVQPFPFVSYEAERLVAYRNTTWTAGQTLEFPISAAFKPRAFAGGSLRRTRERQESIGVNWFDGSSHASMMSEWRRREWLFAAGAGATAYVVNQFFVTGDLAWSIWNLDTCTDCESRRIRTDALRGSRALALQVGVGVSF